MWGGSSGSWGGWHGGGSSSWHGSGNHGGKGWQSGGWGKGKGQGKGWEKGGKGGKGKSISISDALASLNTHAQEQQQLAAWTQMMAAAGGLNAQASTPWTSPAGAPAGWMQPDGGLPAPAQPP